MPPSPTTLDRLWSSFRTLVQAEIRSVVGYPATYEYTVVATDGSTVDATPLDTTPGLPAVNKAPLRASSIGAYRPTTGKTCHVLFANGDKRRPRVVWCEPNAGAAVARVGDSVSVGKLQAGPYPVTTGGSGTAIDGTITSGSSQVSSE